MDMNYDPKCLYLLPNREHGRKRTNGLTLFFNPSGELIFDIEQDYNSEIVDLDTYCQCIYCILRKLKCHCAGCVKSFAFNEPPNERCISLEEMKFWLDVPGKCCCLFMPCRPNKYQIDLEECSCLCALCTLTFPECPCDHCTYFIDKQHNLCTVNICKHSICEARCDDKLFVHTNQFYAKMYDIDILKNHCLFNHIWRECVKLYYPKF